MSVCLLIDEKIKKIIFLLKNNFCDKIKKYMFYYTHHIGTHCVCTFFRILRDLAICKIQGGDFSIMGTVRCHH